MNAPNDSDLLAAEPVPTAKANFGIVDLMLVTVAFATALALQHNLQLVPYRISPKDPFWGTLFYVKTVGFNALTSYGVLHLFRSRRNWKLAFSERKSWEPGHLMLLMQLAAMTWPVAFAILGFLTSYFSDQLEEQNLETIVIVGFHFCQAGASLASLILALFGIFACRHRWWVPAFGVLAFWSFVCVASQWPLLLMMQGNTYKNLQGWISTMMISSWILLLLSVVFVFVAIKKDLKKKIQRDAAHWIGIVCLICQTLVTFLLWCLAFSFLGFGMMRL